MIVSLGLLTLLSACGPKTGQAVSSQVVATVNKSEISVHQLNHVLEQRRELQTFGAAAPSKALEVLLDQEVAVQAALSDKLDRDPRVLIALEAGRREILARAYLERATASSTASSDDDVTRYYSENPALFKARRIYLLQEADIEAAPGKVTTLEGQLTALKSAGAVAQAIASSGLKHTLQTVARTPETLPMPVLASVAALSEGQTLLVATPMGARALTLVSSMPAPATLAQARPAIEQYLGNRTRVAAAEAQVKALRDKADIRRYGALADPAPAAAAP